MPTYEYHCPACDSSYELRQGFNAETTHTCEQCGEATAKRVLYAPPVVFKGSGWYVTDSRSKNPAVSESKPEGTEPAKTEATRTEPTRTSESSPASITPEASAAS